MRLISISALMPRDARDLFINTEAINKIDVRGDQIMVWIEGDADYLALDCSILELFAVQPLLESNS